MDKKREFNSILASVFAFIVLSLLILAASYDVPVSLFALKFTLGMLYYPFIALEILVLAFIARIAFGRHEAAGATP